MVSVVRLISFGLVMLLLSMLYYKWGNGGYIICIGLVEFLILNFDINIKNKLINLFLLFS